MVVHPSVVSDNTERRLQSRNGNESADTDVSKAEGLTTGEESCNVSAFCGLRRATERECVTFGLLSWVVLGCYSVIVARPPGSSYFFTGVIAGEKIHV